MAVELDWIEEMIEREATPESQRGETTVEFCKQRDIPIRTYYYHAAKPDNQKKILEFSLNLAKRFTSDIMENLAIRAKSDNKAAEMFLDYVLQLSKTIGLTVDIKDNLTKEQKATLDKLYAQQVGNGQSSTGDISGESVSV